MEGYWKGSNVSDEAIWVPKVREAVKQRGLWFALLYRSFARVLPPAEVERLAREAIYEFGRIKGQGDAEGFTARQWVEKHVAKGSYAVFASGISAGDDFCSQDMTYCPLLEAWRELGCTQEEMDLLCDIAMEGDRGRAEVNGIQMEIPLRMGKGDCSCRLVLRDAAPAE